MLVLIAAVSKNGVIGKDNKLPWDCPLDMKWFKEQTTGNIVVMGRKTYESVGRLKNRIANIVLSEQNPGYSPVEGVTYTDSSDAVIGMSLGYDVYVIGGETIYRLFLTKHLDKVDKVLITNVPKEVDGDAFFPIPLLHESFVEAKQIHLGDNIYVSEYQKR